MTIALLVCSYFIVGGLFSITIRSLIFDRSVSNQLTKLNIKIKELPFTYKEESSFSEKQKIEWAIRQAKEWDSSDWQIMAIITFFYWPVTTVLFFSKRLVEYLVTKNFKFLPSSKYEKRIKELDEKENLEEKYNEALQTLKAAGINIGEILDDRSYKTKSKN